MSEDQKKQLEQQLWNIANTLRGKMDADEFRDYILGFIFYKYLSERMHAYADSILKQDGIKYIDIKEDTATGKEYIEAIREETLVKLGYFLEPSELFSEIAKRWNSDKKGENNFILENLGMILPTSNNLPLVQPVRMIPILCLNILNLIQLNREWKDQQRKNWFQSF